MSSTIDTVVIFIFSAFLLCIGLLFSRTGKNLKSFFAGGESVPWPIGGLSLFMSFFSAGTFVAWGAIAYKQGWVAITIQWTMCLGALITALFIAPRWKAARNLTAAEFVRERLGQTVQKTYIAVFTIVSVFIKGTVLYPVAKLVSISLGFALMPCTIVLGLFMIAYTALGGLWAIMVTDILQFVILTAAVLILLPLTYHKAGGWEHFVQSVPSSFFHLLNGEYTLGFMIAFVLYHICYIGGNWTFVQRYTSVDSPRAARKTALLFAALYLISPIIWMLPPMLYHSINPSLSGLDTENAYLMVCKLILPPGLLGLMLTGMYFSTSASANTTLNVVAAVFTNDIYRGFINPQASDKILMRVARISSWAFGLCMIVIALIIPVIGGLVEAIFSIAAITGGPLLAPPIWALFSKRLNGKATLLITSITLFINLFFKIITPPLFNIKLDRAMETMTGVGIPLILLLINECYNAHKHRTAAEYTNYLYLKSVKKEIPASSENKDFIRRQNRFGLKVIAGSLLFVSVMLFILSYYTSSGKSVTAILAVIILLCAVIPWTVAKRIRV